MTVTHGMDPREVRSIAALLGDAAGQLHDIGASASTIVEALEWQGPDVARLQEQWRGSGRPQLESAAGDLRTVAKSLDGQVDQQDEASGNGSGSAPGGSGLPDLGAIFGRTFVAHDSGGFFGWLGDAAGDVWDGISGAGSAIGHGLGDLFHGGLSVLGHGVNFLGDVAGKGLGWAAGAIDWGTDKLGGAVSGLAHGTGWLLGKVGLGGAGDFISSLGDRVGGGISAFGDAMPRLADSITGFVHTIGDPLSQGRLPTLTEVAAGGLLVFGNAAGAVGNAAAGHDLHWFDDGTGQAGQPVTVPPGEVTDPTSLGNLIHSVDDAGGARNPGEGNVRITSVTQDGHTAYIVSVPGTSDWGPGTGSQSPVDLTGNLVAMTGQPSAAQVAVQQTMANAHIPSDAPVMLVGHSQGGIITSHLTADPQFMSQYHVTNMMTFGAPIQTVNPDPRVQVLALQHTTDLVPKLDLGGVTVAGVPMTGYTSNVHQVTLDNVSSPWDVGGNHAGSGYEQSVNHATGSDAAALQGYQNSGSMDPFIDHGNATVTAVDVPVTRKVK